MKKEKLKKAVVDIDNTLWHFCDALYERLSVINKAVPNPDNWVEWDFWKNYCSENDFFKAIKEIHLSQDDSRHQPYPESQSFLRDLKENGYHIIIASHRSPESFNQTKRWLKTHNLFFDEIHLSYDKTVLIDTNCAAVVDDTPYVLKRATETGIKAAGLLFPWNREIGSNGYRLCKNLNEVLEHLFAIKRG